MTTESAEKDTKMIHPDGTKVRVIERSVSSDEEVNDNAATVGREYVIFCYANGAEGDDPDGKPYYLLDREGISFGGDVWVYPEHIEVVQTLTEREAREVPGLKDLRNAVSSAVLSMHDYSVSAVDFEGDGELLAYGETDEGLGFTFRVRIDQIEEWDQW